MRPDAQCARAAVFFFLVRNTAASAVYKNLYDVIFKHDAYIGPYIFSFNTSLLRYDITLKSC